MAIQSVELVEYLNALSRVEDPVLQRMEAEAQRDRFPIIGPAAGQFCYLMARAIGARRVFELGSGYGYSTLWFARAVRDGGGGEVYHTVWDEALSRRARANLAEAGLADLVRFHVGEAVAYLRRVDGPFDLIFNDIDKEGYPASLPVIKEKLRPGGVLILDNALWQGRVWDPAERSATTEAIRSVTRMVWSDPDFVARQIVPIRDGLLVALRA